MLKLSIHSCAPRDVSMFNVLGRMDIAYEKLQARADYKTLMFSTGIGEHPPTTIKDYPRWSASVWDLVARIICLTLNHKEAIHPVDVGFMRKPAYMQNLSAVVEHWPDGTDTKIARIATAHIRMGHRKGHYWATFESDLQNEKIESTLFLHMPPGISPWDLLARAYAWSVHEAFELPDRPALYKPPVVTENERSLVLVDTVREPARGGLIRWMRRSAETYSMLASFDGDAVTEDQFIKFLEKAV